MSNSKLTTCTLFLEFSFFKVTTIKVTGSAVTTRHREDCRMCLTNFRRLLSLRNNSEWKFECLHSEKSKQSSVNSIPRAREANFQLRQKIPAGDGKLQRENGFAAQICCRSVILPTGNPARRSYWLPSAEIANLKGKSATFPSSNVARVDLRVRCCVRCAIVCARPRAPVLPKSSAQLSICPVYRQFLPKTNVKMKLNFANLIHFAPSTVILRPISSNFKNRLPPVATHIMEALFYTIVVCLALITIILSVVLRDAAQV